jgi:GNAT superfamily N-acetyltransferase
MLHQHNGYHLDDAITRIDFARVTAWLASTYWSPGISRERVEQGARYSTLVLGAYLDHQQVAFARVLSDTTRFAYLADVYVDTPHRGKGLARALVHFALTHPLLTTVDKWILRTEDAHTVYEPLGFRLITDAERWMSYTPLKK